MISSKPSQYIKGWVEFYKLKFKVNPNVLIPRPETELLVDEVIKNQDKITVLDIGTGCGNIAISIAKNAKNARIFATDISPEALEIAKENARKHRVEKRIFFIQSDLLSLFNSHSGNDNLIIVTNLPYIPTERIPYLDPSVVDFEPLIALDGGRDGFELYRKLFSQIKERNWQPKLIIGEIDYTHGELAVNVAQKYFPEARVEVKTDLAHKQRILKITLMANLPD